MPPKRHLIPPKFQVPILIVVAAIFVAVLIRQLGGVKRVGGPDLGPLGGVQDAAAAVDVPIDDLRKLLLDINASVVEPRQVTREPGPLKRDPFRYPPRPPQPVPPPPQPVPQATDSQQPDAPDGAAQAATRAMDKRRLALEAAQREAAEREERRIEEDRRKREAEEQRQKDQERQQALAKLRLAGTISLGGEDIALINGKQVGQGAKIDRFVVKHIGKGSVVIEDEVGRAVLSLGKPGATVLESETGLGGAGAHDKQGGQDQ